MTQVEEKKLSRAELYATVAYTTLAKEVCKHLCLDCRLQSSSFVFVLQHQSSFVSQEVDRILKHYDLGEYRSIKVCAFRTSSLGALTIFTPFHFLPQALSGGLSNSNYRLETTKGVYLLKICDEKDFDELTVG